MITTAQRAQYLQQILTLLDAQHIALAPHERQHIELADFALAHFPLSGLGILVYINNDRYCAKEIIMLPRQTCPEHRHPPFQNNPGKTETFRCRRGIVHLFVPGTRTENPNAQPPQGSEGGGHYSVFHQITLHPGDQYTIPPNTPHWFQSGPEGAIVSEFSSPSRDDLDIFTDPRIKRVET